MATRLSKVLALALLLSGAAHAQLYTRFGPANGILVGSTTTPQTTAAAWANIQALLTGTCDASHVVSGAGGCVTAYTGSIPNGVLKGSAGSILSAASSDVLALFSGTCNSSTFLNGAGACATPALTAAGLSNDVQFNNGGVLGGDNGFKYLGSGVVVLANQGDLQFLDSGGTARTALNYTSANNIILTQGSPSGGDIDVENLSPTGAINFFTNGVSRGVLNSVGNWQLNAATGAATLTVYGSASQYGVTYWGNTGAGTSFGPLINAGTNSSDWALRVFNAPSTTNFFNIYGNGGVTVGSTPADEGLGTLNANGLFVNGAAVLTGNQAITLSGDAAGSGTTSIPVTLANTGVTAGGYNLVDVTLDAKGRVTAAANGTSANVIGTFSGTCDSSHFLRGDGSCATVGSGSTVYAITLSWPGGTGCTATGDVTSCTRTGTGVYTFSTPTSVTNCVSSIGGALTVGQTPPSWSISGTAGTGPFTLRTFAATSSTNSALVAADFSSTVVSIICK